jgi:hypothetical protein
MKRLIAAMIATAALTGPVYAQAAKSPLQEEYAQKKAERERNAKQYEAAMKRDKTQAATPVVTDPWQNMRGTDETKTKR